MIIKSPVTGKIPKISKSAFIAPTALILGDVTIEAGANIWYGAVLRGDLCSIHVGKNTSIQDNAVLHSDYNTECWVGDNIIVGHKATVHGPCHVGNNSMVGIDSVVLQGTEMGEGVLLGAGAVARNQVPKLSLMVGVPAKKKRDLDENFLETAKEDALHYVEIAQQYIAQGFNHPGVEKYWFD
ncbi:MAG: gamma carbonic anhydrase family protein [Promethearchaeota archaeon]